MKVAYLCSPGIYGSFTTFRNFRAGLEGQDIELRWVGHGKWAADGLNAGDWESERARGEVVGAESTDYEFLGKSLVRHLIENKYDVVILNAPQNASELNSARYLPAHIVRVLMLVGMGAGNYRVCRGIVDHVHATIGLTPRLQRDLIAGYGFDEKRTFAGAGMDLSPFKNLPERGESAALRLLYFGRIRDRIKGVFHLPTIMRRLGDENVELEIAGDGPDLG